MLTVEHSVPSPARGHLVGQSKSRLPAPHPQGLACSIATAPADRSSIMFPSTHAFSRARTLRAFVLRPH